ncbi:MAG TPA: ComF family protein [Syntrophales bacterium]|nr:ComF family protein [Syntrophales bacterium]HRT61761.1 ComF family protein [Syntrophales bacterium]
MKTILRGLADVLFPPACVVCGEILDEDLPFSFCRDCFSGIRFIDPPLCPGCGMPYAAGSASDHPCGDCLSRKQHFTAARSLGVYENALLKAIQRFKYQGSLHVGEALGSLMASHLYPAFDRTEYDVIMPVPLHVNRLRERGFNQSLLLARAIARTSPAELDFTTLRRAVGTASQTGLKKEDRAKNVRGAFELADGSRVKGKKVLVIDDVYTTGSTVRECARVLMKGGAGSVGVLTLARAL